MVVVVDSCFSFGATKARKRENKIFQKLFHLAVTNRILSSRGKSLQQQFLVVESFSFPFIIRYFFFFLLLAFLPFVSFILHIIHIIYISKNSQISFFFPILYCIQMDVFNTKQPSPFHSVLLRASHHLNEIKTLGIAYISLHSLYFSPK